MSFVNSYNTVEETFMNLPLYSLKQKILLKARVFKISKTLQQTNLSKDELKTHKIWAPLIGGIA